MNSSSKRSVAFAWSVALVLVAGVALLPQPADAASFCSNYTNKPCLNEGQQVLCYNTGCPSWTLWNGSCQCQYGRWSCTEDTPCGGDTSTAGAAAAPAETAAPAEAAPAAQPLEPPAERPWEMPAPQQKCETFCDEGTCTICYDCTGRCMGISCPWGDFQC